MPLLEDGSVDSNQRNDERGYGRGLRRVRLAVHGLRGLQAVLLAQLRELLVLAVTRRVVSHRRRVFCLTRAEQSARVRRHGKLQKKQRAEASPSGEPLTR